MTEGVLFLEGHVVFDQRLSNLYLVCLVQLQAGPGSVWGLISSNGEEEDYNYCADDGEDVDGEDLNYYEDHVVSEQQLVVLSVSDSSLIP